MLKNSGDSVWLVPDSNRNASKITIDEHDVGCSFEIIYSRNIIYKIHNIYFL